MPLIDCDCEIEHVSSEYRARVAREIMGEHRVAHQREAQGRVQQSGNMDAEYCGFSSEVAVRRFADEGANLNVGSPTMWKEAALELVFEDAVQVPSAISSARGSAE